MEYKINGYQPEALFHFFEDLSAIPRGSGEEKAVSDWIVAFARERGLEVTQDAAWNVIVRKPGTKGSEDRPPVLLQGHIDMVNEKTADSPHDFSRDGIDILVREDGWATANGTTLGADDGAGAALMLAVLDAEDLTHPPLECVFTTGEEVGFVGASQLDFSKIRSRTMINLDSEDEGIATVSCAGGMEYYCKTEIDREEVRGFVVSLELTGLLGGHSGCDIHLERTNAIKLGARTVNRLMDISGAQIVTLEGGTKDNAIPRDFRASLIFPDTKTAATAMAELKLLERTYRAELAAREPGFRMIYSCEPHKYVQAITEADSERLIHALCLAPDGVRHRDPETGFILTSLNLGILRVDDTEAVLTFAPRSSVDSLQEETCELLQLLADSFGFDTSEAGVYPGWEYIADSPLRECFVSTYRDLFGEELVIEGIHAGLECGLFAEHLPGLDAISVGPTLRNVHTPDESFDLHSAERFYRLLQEVLKRLG